MKDVRYPAEYGNGTQPRKVVHHDYDVASRLTGLTVDGQNHASQITYNAASQTTQLKVGVSGANQITENYAYHAPTGLLDSQTVVRGSATTLLNLGYDYLRPNTSSGRTGQLTKIVNNLNSNKDRSYSYDALGRLIQAKGGLSGSLWTQTYSYDRYGNRTSVSATGFSASVKPSPGTAGVPPALSAKREQSGSPTEFSQSEIRNSQSEIPSPTDQLAARTNVELPDSLRTDAPRSISDSSFNLSSRPVPTRPATPQGSPVFTDDPLVAGVTVIKAVHVTELRDWFWFDGGESRKSFRSENGSWEVLVDADRPYWVLTCELMRG